MHFIYILSDQQMGYLMMVPLATIIIAFGFFILSRVYDIAKKRLRSADNE